MTRKLIVPVLIAALLLVALTVGVNAQTYWQRMDNVLVKSLESTGAVQVDGALNVDGAATFAALNASGNMATSGNMTVNGERLSIAEWVGAAPQAALTITDGGIITPTGTLQMLTAAGAVTASLASGQAGDMLILVNTAAQNITVADTTGQLFASTYVMGQWDTLTLVFYGTSWIELARSVN